MRRSKGGAHGEFRIRRSAEVGRDGRRQAETSGVETQTTASKVDVYVDSEWANSAREEVDKWRHHDDQWHGGETVG